jgi:hypothetical protein
MDETTHVEKIKEMLDELEIDSFNQSLIKDNKIIFLIDNMVYRCTMPTQKHLTLAEDLENRLKITMLQNNQYATRSKLKKILKENQNIDIDSLEEKREDVQKKLRHVLLDIANTLTEEDDKLDKLKKKKKNIEEELTEVIYEITDNLNPCIENQTQKKYYEYITHVCTEKQTGDDKWGLVWASLEEYENDNSKLAHTAVAYLQTLMINIRS